MTQRKKEHVITLSKRIKITKLKVHYNSNFGKKRYLCLMKNTE